MRKTPKAKERPASIARDKPLNVQRLKTEMLPVPNTAYLETHIPKEKIKLRKDTILKVLTDLSSSLCEYTLLLESFQEKKVLGSLHLQKVAEHFFFLKSQFFRFEDSSHEESLRNLRELAETARATVRALAETNNILRDEGSAYVKDEAEFCQFFKYLFGKQCPKFHQKYLRKVLQEIWNFVFFEEKYPHRILESLVLWCHGISFPTNPAKIQLHQAVVSGDSDFIKKACHFRKKSPIYCHVNEADANGITPLMLAVYLHKESVLSALLLEYADPYLVPLTRMPDPRKAFQDIRDQIQLMRGHVRLEKFSLPERQTKNIMEYCRDNNIPLLAKLVALDTSREFYSFKSNKSLIDSLDKIPDCSFQICLKQQGRLFGQAYSDTIKVFKKRANIRFDFSVVGVFDKSVSRGSYSLVFKGKPDIEFYVVDYNAKKITNLIKEIEIQQLEEKVMRIVKDTFTGREMITDCQVEESVVKNTKGSYKSTLLNVLFERESIKKDTINREDFKKYEESVFRSEVVDYTRLTHSETNYALDEYLPQSCPKPTRRKIQERIKIEINTIPFFQLNMGHLLTVSSLLQSYSPHFNKVVEILRWQKMLEEISAKGIFKEFPTKAVIEMKGIHLTVLLENFVFQSMKNEMFELLSTLEENDFDCVLPRGTSFVKSQQSVEESFVSSVTKFLRPGEEDVQFDEACVKYQKLLSDLSEGEDAVMEENVEIDLRQVKESPFKKKHL